MASDSHSVVPKRDHPKKPKFTPDYEKIVYAPERVEKWLSGELSLQELTAISPQEILQTAVYGFQLYEQGKYKDARVIFEGLKALNPKESYFQTALGAIHLAQEE